jgi:endonuclease/exonuclease/phosphatase family metal-dependent hydrolase
MSLLSLLPLSWFQLVFFLFSILPHGAVKTSSAGFRYAGRSTDVLPEDVRVLSYNTWGLPVALPGHDHERRFPLIADSLLTFDADIVCLQETFHPELRNQLIEKLGKEYFGYQDYRCSTAIIPFVNKDCYGGLMTLSRYPIISEYFFKYPVTEATSMIERIGAKGFLFSVIQAGPMTINVINTHLYAGYDAFAEARRMEQITFMDSVLQTLPEYGLYPAVFAGDLNAQHPDMACSQVYDYVAYNMEFTDTKQHISRSDLTSDAGVNAYISKKEIPSKLDYVFYKPAEHGAIIVKHTGRCFHTGRPVSDHFGWSATLAVQTRVSGAIPALAMR